MATGKYGLQVSADILLPEAERTVADFDALIVVGGSGVRAYFENPSAKNIVRFAYEAGKFIAAICAGPGLLAYAGILKDMRVTAHRSEAETVQRFGAMFTGRTVEVDNRLITADGPESAQQFAEKIAAALQ